MENLKALKHGIQHMSEKTRYDLVGSFIHGVSEELDGMDVKFIHFQDIIRWIYDDNLSNKQILSKYVSEMKRQLNASTRSSRRAFIGAYISPKRKRKIICI